MNSLNWVDYIILGIFLASIVAGLMRGVVKEVLSLLTWLAAFVVASLFSSTLANSFTSSSSVQSAVSTASNHIGAHAATSVSMLAIGVSFAILFIGTLIVGSLINYVISRVVQGGGISIANCLLGGIFGVLRGYLINLLVVFLVQLSPLADQAAWAQSELVRSFQPAAQWLSNIVEPKLKNLKEKVGQTLENTNAQGVIHNFTGGGTVP